MWLKIFENFGLYDKDKPFEPWAARICVNLYRNFLRRLKINPVFDGFFSTDEKDEAVNNVKADEPPDYENLHEAVNGLPEKLRTTVILYYFRDMDISETARILKIPEGTVKSRLNNAKKKIKEVLGDETNL